MRTRKMLPIPVILVILALFLASCGASGPATTPPTPLNGLDVYDIDVNVHTVPQVNLRQPFTVSASISSLYPFSELYGVATNPSLSSRSATLAQLLRPTSYRGTYALCMIVSLQVDDPSAFSIDETTTPEFQEFTLVPGVTNSQTVNWSVTPIDTFGAASVEHALSVDVAFDSQVSCQPGNVSLLRQAVSGDAPPLTYHLVSTTNNTVIFSQTSVINPQLTTEAAFVNGLRTVVGITLPSLLTSILLGMLGWMTGFFLEMRKRLIGYRISGHNQAATVPALSQPKQQRSGITLMTSIVLVTIGVLGMGGGLLLIFFGPATTLSFFTSIVVALVGMAIIIAGVWIVMPKKETVLAPTLIDAATRR
jgi:hypothetical protein